MAYIDFRMKPPPADATAQANGPAAVERKRAPRASNPHAALWIGGGIAAIVLALIFALAFASIGEPFVAGIVTLLLLLPAASLFGGDGGRRS